MQRQSWKRPERRVARCTNYFHALMQQALETFDLEGVVLEVECRSMMHTADSGMSMIYVSYAPCYVPLCT